MTNGTKTGWFRKSEAKIALFDPISEKFLVAIFGVTTVRENTHVWNIQCIYSL